MPDPTPEHIELLRDLLSTLRDLAVAQRDHMTRVEPALKAHQAEVDARMAAHAKALAEAQAEITRLEALAAARGKVAEAEGKASDAEAEASRKWIRAYALDALKVAIGLLLGGGTIVGYIGFDKAQADVPAVEVSP